MTRLWVRLSKNSEMYKLVDFSPPRRPEKKLKTTFNFTYLGSSGRGI